MEAEIVPMCEDQGMGITTWSSLGGGQLLSAEQRRQQAENPESRKGPQPDIALCDALEKLAGEKKTTVQGVVGFLPLAMVSGLISSQALAYLRHQSPYVFPVVGVNTVGHVEALPDSLGIALSKEDVESIHEASPFEPPFPMNFLYNYKRTQKYNLGLTPANNQQYQMGGWIDAVPKQFVSTA